MAAANVSSCVQAIIASFDRGLDIFQKLRESRRKGLRKRSKKNASVGEAELRLERSLRQGPAAIKTEYRQGVQTIGEDFALGDGIAQTSLAEILLNINTGFVSVLGSFLVKGGKGISLDHQSLMNLSESSSIDTCRTLRQLLRRMLLVRPSVSHRSGEETTSSLSKISKGAKVQRAPVVSPKRARRSRPILARVVVADSSKPSEVAIVRSVGKVKKPGSSTISSPRFPPEALRSRLDIRPAGVQLTTAGQPTKKTMPIRSPELRNKFSAVDINHEPSTEALQRNRAALHRPAQQAQGETALAAPSTVSSPEPRRRKPVPSSYSIESRSTKLGEIPLHKWAEPFDFDAMSRINREAELNGWPYTDQDVDSERKRTGLRTFRLFRRKKN